MQLDQPIVWVAGAVALVAGTYLVIFFYFLLPADMARERNRDPYDWVLIALVGSPVLAVLLLWVLGDAEA